MKALIALLTAVVMFIPSYAGADDTVRRGDSGPVVTEVQTILSGFGYSVVVDSRFGPQTEKAVLSWQRSNGLQVDGVVGPVTLMSLRSARRIGNQTQVTSTLPPPPMTGLNGLPFAPAGLSDCDEMMFYGAQVGLPAAFGALGWRESNCRNEDEVRTFCCYGYWQNYISSHLSRQSAYRQRIIDECHVRGADDINSDVPLDKQRQACVTAVVFEISGYSPWAL